MDYGVIFMVQLFLVIYLQDYGALINVYMRLSQIVHACLCTTQYFTESKACFIDIL